MTEVGLRRVLGPFMLAVYGLGTIVGAGIYVLIGEVAGVAGGWMPVSFLLAGIIAGFTGLTYAELATRLPVCAGEAAYVQSAWNSRTLSRLVGAAIVLTGVVSSATIASGFVGYLNVFFAAKRDVAILALVLSLGVVAASGMRSSARMVLLITLIELGGLLYVCLSSFTASAFHLPFPTVDSLSAEAMPGVLLGSFLAFYAFIGFEDMVNIIEEVKRPERNFPIAVISALLLSVLLYILVGLAALGLESPEVLAASSAPMAALIEKTGGNPLFISGISLLAVINGALVQIIMGARVLYGMSSQSLAPVIFSGINPKTHTPVAATVVICLTVLVFALVLPLVSLARLTSLLMLAVFAVVNLSLLVLRRCSGRASFQVWGWVPVAGLVSSVMLILFQLWQG